MNSQFTTEHWWEDGTPQEADSQVLRIAIVKNNESDHCLVTAFLRDSKLEINVAAHDEEYALFIRSFFGEAGILAYIRDRFIMHYGNSLKGSLIPR